MGFPSMRDAFSGWTYNNKLRRVTKSITDHETTETVNDIFINALIVPMNPQAIALKPEGQRQWKWNTAITKQEFQLDDILIDEKDVQYRVMSKADYSKYGKFYNYELTEAFRSVDSE
jgi:isopentenyl diphosphate isomerase/L-lactate dehydrogenase-like FMN-dependent dehydrogenase